MATDYFTYAANLSRKQAAMSYDAWKTTPPDDADEPLWQTCGNCKDRFLVDDDTPVWSWCETCERRIRQAITSQFRRADDAERVLREQAS